MQLMTIHRYPVKSCAGTVLDDAVVEPWGLRGDRRWMVVDPDGSFITARSAPTLLAVEPEILETGLRLHLAGREPLEVATPRHTHGQKVEVWSSVLEAAVADDAAHAWLSEVLDRPVRLVHMADPTLRPSDPRYSRTDDRVSLADGYPLLLTSDASLAALNEALAADGHAALPMSRFRPNVTVDGDEPWAEDAWRRLRIGAVTFRAVKGCARCVMTTMEPDPAKGTVATGREPLRTLARIRRYGQGLYFGVNLIPDLDPQGPEPVLRFGDPVQVIDAVAPGAAPVGSGV